MPQLDGPEESIIASLLEKHIGSIESLDRAMHHKGHGHVNGYAVNLTLPETVAKIVSAFSNKFQIGELVQDLLDDPEGLNGSCPPIRDWLKQMGPQLIERKNQTDSSPHPTPNIRDDSTKEEESSSKRRVPPRTRSTPLRLPEHVGACVAASAFATLTVVSFAACFHSSTPRIVCMAYSTIITFGAWSLYVWALLRTFGARPSVLWHLFLALLSPIAVFVFFAVHFGIAEGDLYKFF